MPLDELEQLSDLIGLRLAVDLLGIQELRDTGVHEDVMASAYTGEAESECFCERTRLGEPRVQGWPRQSLHENLDASIRYLRIYVECVYFRRERRVRRAARL